MASHQQEVINGLRDFVEILRNAPRQPRYTTTLVTFAGEPETVMEAQPLEKLAINYQAAGEGTAAWDAFAHAFWLEKSRGEPTICFIVTDGRDNCSREANYREIADQIQARREWGNWTFVWLDLGDKPNKNARALGIECLKAHRTNVANALTEVARQIARVGARIAGGGPRRLADRNGRT
jgi:hypothetical protein